MTNNSVHTSGQCRCGRIRFEVSTEPLITFVCHCTGCQRMTASAFSLSSLFRNDAFRVTTGEPVIGGLHGELRHYFCAYCMSWLFTRPDSLGDFVNVRATLLDDAQSFTPFVETCADEKLLWVQTPAVQSFGKFPPPELFPQLLAEFAMRSR